MANKHYPQDKEIEVTLKLKVKVTNISNYDAMDDGDIDEALEAFEDEIADELIDKIEGEHMEELPINCDYISYTVEKIK